MNIGRGRTLLWGAMHRKDVGRIFCQATNGVHPQSAYNRYRSIEVSACDKRDPERVTVMNGHVKWKMTT